MKKISLLFIILIIVGNYSCERDDICSDATATTPRLIIDFIDATDSDVYLNVLDLVVIGGDFYTDPISNSTEDILEDYTYSDTDNVILPLKTTEDSTEYVLISEASVNDNGTSDDDSDDYIDGNPDRIIITYDREEVYVSRACGYKTIFNNVRLQIVEDDDNWMIARTPLTDNQSVEDETTTHFNVTH